MNGNDDAMEEKEVSPGKGHASTKTLPLASWSMGTLFLIALLVASIYLAYLVLSEYLNTIILAIVLSLMFAPVHRWIQGRIGLHRRTLAALCSCTIIVFLFIVPLFFITGSLINQGIDSFNAIQGWVQAGGLERALQLDLVVSAKQHLDKYLAFVDLSKFDLKTAIMDASKQTGQFLLARSSHFVSNLTDIVIKFFLTIFILFFLLKDGKTMAARVVYLTPLSRSQLNRLNSQVLRITRLVLMGTLITALAQGVAGGIALAIVGLPGLFWGTMLAFASLVPIVGTALIWIPVAIYLGFSGDWGYLVFYVLWNVLVVGSIDNFLRPYLMGGEMGMSPMLLLLAILGGLKVFGFIGLLYGPLIFGVCGVLLYLYQLENEPYLNQLMEQ